ncbi:hypothetical protein F4809DRAFT_247408 [Biscogniauxia mediterranea]|nr:hypothetical protein F4809DRAFT_247408 [Biscogniauxia mediterranea]
MWLLLFLPSWLCELAKNMRAQTRRTPSSFLSCAPHERTYTWRYSYSKKKYPDLDIKRGPTIYPPSRCLYIIYLTTWVDIYPSIRHLIRTRDRNKYEEKVPRYLPSNLPYLRPSFS